MSVQSHAAREIASEYRTRRDAKPYDDEVGRLVLDEISGAFAEFAEWLDALE